MTKSVSECTVNMSETEFMAWLRSQGIFKYDVWNTDANVLSMTDAEFVDWLRLRGLLAVNAARFRDVITEEMYGLITMDMLDAKTKDELLSLMDEVKIAVWSKKYSELLERWYRGADLIRVEKNESRKAKMMAKWEAIREEIGEVSRRCMWTRY